MVRSCIRGKSISEKKKEIDDTANDRLDSDITPSMEIPKTPPSTVSRRADHYSSAPGMIGGYLPRL
jgi:hypothetical protein